MDDRRTGKKRRSGKDNRKGGSSSYNGPEKRSLRFRREETARRKRKE